MVSPPFLVANLDATHAHWGCARDPYAEGSMHEWIALFGRMGGNTVVMWCWRCRICYATRRGTRIIAAPGSTVNRKMAWEDYNHLKKFCRTPNCVCRCFVQGRQVCYNRLRLWFGSTANWGCIAVLGKLPFDELRANEKACPFALSSSKGEFVTNLKCARQLATVARSPD